MPKLTIRHELMLEMMKNTVTLLTGKAPTRAALVKALGPQWIDARKEQLQELTRKGVLKLVGRTARSIRAPQPQAQAEHPRTALCELASTTAGRGQKHPAKTIMHVNQHVIRKNTKEGTDDPVLTIKTSKSNTYAHEVEIRDKQGNVLGRLVHRPHKPLSCGARVWIEAYGEYATVVVTR